MLAPFGGNLEGVRSASLAYFGKEPRKLSYRGGGAAGRAAAGRPNGDGPTSSPRPRGSPARAYCSALWPAASSTRTRKRSPSASRSHWRDATSQPLRPMRRRKRSQPILRRTSLRLSIDARLQAKLETLAREGAARLGPKLSAAIVAIDNASGEIHARIGTPIISTPRAAARSTCRARRVRRVRR